MSHAHAWGMPYLFTLLGAKQVYPGKYQADAILRLIEAEEVTFSHAGPATLDMLLSDPAMDTVDPAGWKVMIGGSALPRELYRAAMKRGINLFSAYGMSEACPLLAIADAKPHLPAWEVERQLEIRCSAGIPGPFVELEIVDPDGKPLPRGGKHTGEVVVRSPWLVQSYYKEPEKSEALWRDGWLHTGDEGYVDSEGYLHITDRVQDVIKTGGEWIATLGLEGITSRCEAVSAANGDGQMFTQTEKERKEYHA
jgi:fatty-acyl-CoA synthase